MSRARHASPVIADCVVRYAAKLHAFIGTRHHVASPLGAWLLLGLAGPASSGDDRAALTEVLGCDVDVAATAAADLLARPHPLVASAAAVWTAHGATLSESFERWQAGLPAEVTTGALPDQAGLDRWAQQHTFGLIQRFPIDVTPDTYLAMATALATKVSWQVPFDLLPAARLGQRSPWSASLGSVLATPDRDGGRGHTQFIAPTAEAGDVAVHAATARGGLIVASVIAEPGVPPGRVLEAAHRIGWAHATGAPVQHRSLTGLPLGEGPLWVLREEPSTRQDGCRAVLPAWSAESKHDLRAPELGFAAAKHALTGNPDPWQAKQSAMARYTRTGFEAAAVTAIAIELAAMPSRKRRVAELRFGHPYAAVAVAADPAPQEWQGLPVFSAWVATPEDASTDAR
jgi:Serpin (serine protease inhibitor)